MNGWPRTALASIGAASLIAAVVGGGVQVAGSEFPVIAGLRQQLLLFGMGVVLLVLALWRPRRAQFVAFEVTAPTTSLSVPTGTISDPGYKTTTFGGQSTVIHAASYRKSDDGKTYIFVDGNDVPVHELPCNRVATVVRVPRSASRR